MTLVAAYNSAIDIALAEIKEMATRNTSIPRSPSANNVPSTGGSATVRISTQALTEALGSLEMGIPPLPPTPPAKPAYSPQNGRRSGDSEVDIWSEPADEDGVNVMFHESGKIRAGTLNKLVERLTSPTHAGKFL